MTHETKESSAELLRTALMDEADRVRNELFNDLRQKIEDAGWDPYANDVELTLRIEDGDPTSNQVVLIAEARRPAPQWVPYVETSPVAFCSRCRRSTWSTEELEQGTCRMPQPSGQKCGGTWVAR